jgi:hypothetical protein
MMQQKRPPGRPPSWTAEHIEQLRRLWKEGIVVSGIAVCLGKSPDAVTSKRRQLGLPEREKIVFSVQVFSTQQIVYVFPRSHGVRKLLRRLETLREWVHEGRDGYELARSFHVPIADVRFVLGKLQLDRPAEQVAPQEAAVASRRCSACSKPFAATQYRFRCDPCIERAARLDDSEYDLGVAA